MWPFDRKRKKLEKEKLEQQQKAMSNPHQNQMQPSRSANLRDADLRSADLPSPTMVLLANWSGKLSEQLTADLIWVNGALMRHEDYLTEMARIFPEHRTDILDLNLWGRLVKPCAKHSMMFCKKGCKQ